MPSVTPDSANIALLRFNEQPSTPTQPASGFSGIYCKADGLYVIDDAGAVTGPLSAAGASAVILNPDSDTRNIIEPSVDYIPLIVRGSAAGQTKKIFVAQEGSADTEVFSIAGAGKAIFQNFTDSTTGFQVFDKDGGTPIFNIDTTNERVGIGTASPGTELDVVGQSTVTYTTTSRSNKAFVVYNTWQPTVSGTGFPRTESISAEWDSANDLTGSTFLSASEFVTFVSSSGIANLHTIDIATQNGGSGTIPTAYDIYLNSTTNSGGGSITVVDGLYIEDKTVGGTNYAIRTNAGNVVFNQANGAGNITFGGTPVSANYDMGLVGDGVLMLKETATPTADTNYGKVYCKNDDKLYFQDGAGTEHEVAFV